MMIIVHVDQVFLSSHVTVQEQQYNIVMHQPSELHLQENPPELLRCAAA